MKRLNKIYILCYFCIIVAGMYSCSDSFLNLEPKTNKVDENSYITEDDAFLAMTSVYKALTCNNGLENVPTNSDICSDDAFAAGEPGGGMWESWQLIETGNPDPVTEGSLLWEKFFKGVYRANTYLQKEVDINWLSSEKRDRMKGEVLTLRAYFYWDLARLYGWVPILREVPPNATAISTIYQDTPDDVYKFIADDLIAALPLLQSDVYQPGEEAGHVTQDVVRVLISRIYSYYHNFVKPIIGSTTTISSEWTTTDGSTVIDKDYVKDCLESIITSGRYYLLPNYADVFSWSNQNNEESIFEWQYSNKGKTPGTNYGGMEKDGNASCTYYGIRPPISDDRLATGWSFATLSFTLYREFESGDPRIYTTLYDAEDSLGNNQYGHGFQNTGYFNFKYMPLAAYISPPEQNLNWPDNYRDIRYAEVLLNAAEMYLLDNPGIALGYLNQVRARVGLPARTSIDAYTLLHERRVEFAGEGHRKWYLMEYDNLSGNGGKLDSVEKYINASFDTAAMPSYVTKSEFVGRRFNKETWGMLPIPASEIQLNPNLQQFVPGFY